MRNSIWWVGALALLSACGPAGTISGRVTVEGGSPGGHAVIIYGPQSAATVTGDDGTFSFSGLPDGKYVVSSSVATADVPDQRVATTVTNGTANPEPVLTFRASTAKVSGRVVMADGSGAENLTVIATGPETRGARTAADGSFSFDGLKTGAYVVSVEAKDTKEGRVGVGVNASGTAEIIELRLTPVGRVKGVVSYMANPAANVNVFVPGTSISAVTDAMGAFSLEGIPAGAQTIIARIGAEPFWRSATEMVTITRGANPDLAMTLSDDMPKTGTVSGVVTFGGARSPRDITVTAPGTGVMATPLANGAFSLTLPVGIWDVIANAPLHPPKILGRVTVTEGSAQALVGQELTWFRPIWRANQPLQGVVPVAGSFSTQQIDANPWTIVAVIENGEVRYALANLSTGEFRIIVYGLGISSIRLSRTAKYAGWHIGPTVFAYEVATGAITSYYAPQAIGRFEFSSDETTLFVVRNNNTLTRIRLGATTAPEIFPPSGTASSITNSTVDRWFLQETTSVRLVTTANHVPDVFTNVSQFAATPATWALTNCAATCELRVLAPDSIAPAVRDTGINPAPGTVALFSGALELRADVPCFTHNTGLTTNAFCVNTAAGQHLPLPALPTQFRINDSVPLAMSRVIWTTTNAGTTALREESFPPGPSTAPLATNTVGYIVGWMSPTRAYGIENTGGTSRVIHLVRSGTATTETDIGTQGVSRNGPLLVFPRAAPGRWVAMLGDGNARQIDVPTTVTVSALSARVWQNTANPLTRYGAVSFDPSTMYIVDEAAGSLRLSTAGQVVAGGSFRSGPTEYTIISRSGVTALHVYNTNTLIEYEEFGTPAAAGTWGLNAWFTIGSDGQTVMMGGFQ